MRTLLLLRGAPGSGKSAWVSENGLKPYTLSPDDIRLMYQSPLLGTDGTCRISGENDDAVWKTLRRMLKSRMKRGDFTVVDATNSRTSELNQYKELCSEFRYRAYCVDFTNVPVEEAKKRNREREPFRRVPETVIDTMYARFATQKVPSGIKVVRPGELDTVWLELRDFSHYEKVHHIGDIHGCNTALQKYLSDNGGIKEDEMYIFVGDYLDRGTENAEVAEFLLSIMERKNVLLLEGNHERELWQWANRESGQGCGNGRATEFELVTAPALERAGISKKDVRNLYRRLGQCAYYRYDGNIYLVTHGGLSIIPENLSFVATEQMLEGVGCFDDAETVAESFRRTMPGNFFQIYGHRNTRQTPLAAGGRVFNLEGQVECGGHLRCLQVSHGGICPVEVKNDVFRSPEEEKAQEALCSSPAAAVLVSLRHNKYIMEKKFGNISSFNYTDEAFYGRVWNSQTVKARGLYLDITKCKVAARAYDKFFNIGECAETNMGRLQDRLRFPVSVYVKENGFLGIVSYNEYEDGLLTACKSTMDSRFAVWLKEMLASRVAPEHLEGMKKYIRENDVCFVFECVDMEHDPHVIGYPESCLVLLDIVHNTAEFKKYGYGEMCAVADVFGLTHKEKACEIRSWQEFFDWRYEVIKEEYVYLGKAGEQIEGFVIEDSNGYMTKQKLFYYNFWKQMRAVAREVAKKGSVSNTASLTTAVANEFYGWLREKYDSGELKGMPKDICSLREMFFRESGSRRE